MSDDINRAERRRLKRERSKSKKIESKKKEKSLSFILLALFTVGLFGMVYWVINRPPALENSEVQVPKMSASHIANTDNFEYNSNPPTSGDHFSNWNRDWKFYESELPIGGLLHNMEHSGVIVFYQTDLPQATKDLVKDFTNSSYKVIATASADIPAPIAMAAWGVYEYFDVFDEAGMKAFTKRNRTKGTENVYP